MKHDAKADKSSAPASAVAQREAAAGGQAVAIAPPTYGIDFIDTPANRTGMPDRLKAGIESLSGMDMSDVRVSFNSGKPAQLGALAYAKGGDIHLAPGQETHLAHEAWHVVQQRQGRVKPTLHEKGVPINDDARLEEEADVMGSRAGAFTGAPSPAARARTAAPAGPAQLKIAMTAAELKTDTNTSWHLITKRYRKVIAKVTAYHKAAEAKEDGLLAEIIELCNGWLDHDDNQVEDAKPDDKASVEKVRNKDTKRGKIRELVRQATAEQRFRQRARENAALVADNARASASASAADLKSAAPELTERGGAKKQTKNWIRGALGQDMLFIHGGSAPFKAQGLAGLDPARAKEDIFIGEGFARPARRLRDLIRPGALESASAAATSGSIDIASAPLAIGSDTKDTVAAGSDTKDAVAKGSESASASVASDAKAEAHPTKFVLSVQFDGEPQENIKASGQLKSLWDWFERPHAFVFRMRAGSVIYSQLGGDPGRQMEVGIPSLIGADAIVAEYLLVAMDPRATQADAKRDGQNRYRRVGARPPAADVKADAKPDLKADAKVDTAAAAPATPVVQGKLDAPAAPVVQRYREWDPKEQKATPDNGKIPKDLLLRDGKWYRRGADDWEPFTGVQVDLDVGADGSVSVAIGTSEGEKWVTIQPEEATAVKTGAETKTPASSAKPRAKTTVGQIIRTSVVADAAGAGTGTLIAPKTVLSAAHVIVKRKAPPPIKANPHSIKAFITAYVTANYQPYETTKSLAFAPDADGKGGRKGGLISAASTAEGAGWEISYNYKWGNVYAPLRLALAELDAKNKNNVGDPAEIWKKEMKEDPPEQFQDAPPPKGSTEIQDTGINWDFGTVKLASELPGPYPALAQMSGDEVKASTVGYPVSGRKEVSERAFTRRTGAAARYFIRPNERASIESGESGGPVLVDGIDGVVNMIGIMIRGGWVQLLEGENVMAELKKQLARMEKG